MTELLLGRILIATDGSEKNRAALDEGIKIARSFGSVVYVVYVIDTGAFSSMSGDVPLGDTYRIFQVEAEQAFSRIKSLAGDVKVETSILEGHPAAEIVKFAVSKKIDMIVIGTQGRRGWNACFSGAWQRRSYALHPAKCLW